MILSSGFPHNTQKHRGKTMNELTDGKTKTMTLKEVAEVTGAAYSTVAAYAQKAGWTENGKQTLLNETQVTLILEAMKQAQPNQTKDTFQAGLEGVETEQSRSVRIAVLAKKRLELSEQIEAELEAEIAELRTEVKTLAFERDEATQEAIHAETAFDYLNRRYHQPSLDRWKQREVRMYGKDCSEPREQAVRSIPKWQGVSYV
jgi:hypothetical protein